MTSSAIKDKLSILTIWMNIKTTHPTEEAVDRRACDK